MVKEKFWEETQILTVCWLSLPIYFKDWYITFSINFISWRTSHKTPRRVSVDLIPVCKAGQTVLTDIQNIYIVKLIWVRGVIPSFTCKFTKLYSLDRLDFSRLLMLFYLFLIEPKILTIFKKSSSLCFLLFLSSIYLLLLLICKIRVV